MNRYRLLRADEIECRVSTLREDGLSILLYKTARTDANLLDETVGDDKWTNDFKLVDGVLYGGIGVDYGNGYVWKWDAGVESNTEAEKGRASDAFKRAGFKHGIGRELYTAPAIWVSSENCFIDRNTKGKLTCYTSFAVGEIKYEKNNISALTIINAKNGKTVFQWKDGEEVRMPKRNIEERKTDELDARILKCADCGAEINVKEHDYSVKYFKRPLCRTCQNASKNR